ncbi:MAG: cobalt-precorrin-5B (C(1))-methyltransferase, partial [Pseudomonadota bacterium]
IHRGVDVARATGTPHIAAAVGATSEGLVRRLYDLPDTALIDMGDFAGGLLKYLRRHPVPKLTIAGGFAKMSKLAQGHLDLHSGRSQVDTAVLAALLEEAGAEPGLVAKARGANTALDVLRMADGYRLGDRIAEAAKRSAVEALRGAEVEIEIVVSDREGRLVGRS